MKDMTEEWVQSLRGENKHRNYVLFGEKKEIPKTIFDSMIASYRFIEMENIKEVSDNYNDLIPKIKIPFGVMFWMLGLMGKISRKVEYMKDFTRFDKLYGNQYRELSGTNYRPLDLLTRRINFPTQIILTDIKIENLVQIKNELFSAYKFDLIDKNGSRIEGVFVYDEYFQQMFSTAESTIIDKRSTIEMVRTSNPATTWIIYGMALSESYRTRDFKIKTRNKRLFVRHIQASGSTIKPDMPFLMVR